MVQNMHIYNKSTGSTFEIVAKIKLLFLFRHRRTYEGSYGSAAKRD